MAIKDEIVVAAELVDAGDKDVVTFGVTSENVTVFLTLAHDKWTCAGAENDLCAACNQRINRINDIAVAITKACVLTFPEIFANGETDARASVRSWNIERDRTRARLEVAVFVEDVVRRQELLVIAGEKFAVAEGQQRVGREKRRFAVCVAHRKGRAEDDGDVARRVLRQRVCRLFAASEEELVREQVTRWIAAENEFGKQNEVGVRECGSRDAISNESGVARDIADEGICRSESETHRGG